MSEKHMFFYWNSKTFDWSLNNRFNLRNFSNSEVDRQKDSR